MVISERTQSKNKSKVSEQELADRAKLGDQYQLSLLDHPRPIKVGVCPRMVLDSLNLEDILLYLKMARGVQI
jgi:hypothetical protein